MKITFNELSEAIDMAKGYVNAEEPVCIIQSENKGQQFFEVIDQYNIEFPINMGYKVIFLYWGYGSTDPRYAKQCLEELPSNLFYNR
jgi:hypothetical protein